MFHKRFCFRFEVFIVLHNCLQFLCSFLYYANVNASSCFFSYSINFRFWRGTTRISSEILFYFFIDRRWFLWLMILHSSFRLLASSQNLLTSSVWWKQSPRSTIKIPRDRPWTTDHQPFWKFESSEFEPSFQAIKQRKFMTTLYTVLLITRKYH